MPGNRALEKGIYSVWDTLSLRSLCATQTVTETPPLYILGSLEEHLGQYNNVHELATKQWEQK